MRARSCAVVPVRPCLSARLLSAALVKDAVNAAYETTLQQGIVHERRLFYSTFATVNKQSGRDQRQRPCGDGRLSGGLLTAG